MREGWRYLVMGEMGRLLGRLGCGRGVSVVVYSAKHLGDVLHTVPLLRRLRAEVGAGQRLEWLVGAWSEEVARRVGMGLGDEVRVFSPEWANQVRGQGEKRQSAWAQWQEGWRLRRDGVDVLVQTGMEDAVGRFLANVIRPRVWVALGDRRPPRVARVVEVRLQPYESRRYEAKALAGLADLAYPGKGGVGTAVRLEWSVTEDERARAEAFLAAEGVGDGERVAVISPGSGSGVKNWAPERFGAVAEWLTKEKGCRVAWVGAEGERSLKPTGREGDLDWMGRTDLGLLGALLKRAVVWVGNDSGVMHLAAAVGCPTVSVWGPTEPEKWAPRGEKHLWVRKWERCPGCVYWDYRVGCARGDHACMEAIGVEDVVGALRNTQLGMG